LGNLSLFAFSGDSFEGDELPEKLRQRPEMILLEITGHGT
jgi:hypothetical protein